MLLERTIESAQLVRVENPILINLRFIFSLIYLDIS